MKKESCYQYVILLFIYLLTTNPAGKYFESGSWIMETPNLDNSFFKTKEAIQIGDNLLYYQHYAGGFPKNILYQEPIDYHKVSTKTWRDHNYTSSIDNNSTTTELIYLAKLYHFTKEEPYRKAMEDGINFLINTQFDNGGYPQKVSRKTYHYQQQITFNDDAMVNVLKLLNSIANKSYPFDFIDDPTALKAKKAFNKGIECILRCQIRQNGILTAWCAQHDKNNFLPCEGRSFEKAAINAKESVNIVLLLMSIENPSQEIINSVEAAVKWFQNSKITGIRQKRIVKANKYIDYTLEQCEKCPPLWGRFYDLKTNKVFYCDKDGITKSSIYDISQERRMGYDWFGSEGIRVLDEYETWKLKIQ